MFDQIENTILSTQQTIFDQFGWAGVFGLMILENATGITPNEIILAFAGWMLIERHGVSPAFIPVAGVYAGLGSAIGASITYWVARIGGRPMINRFTNFFRIETVLISKAEEQMHRWGSGVVLVGRVIPGIRMLISIPAGLAKMPFPKFFIATFIGAYVWCTLLIGAGYLLGYEWRLISEYIKTHIPLVFGIGAIAILCYMAYHFRTHLKAVKWIKTIRNTDTTQ
jgi:membrane protein DedA with SNARE-associated domain